MNSPQYVPLQLQTSALLESSSNQRPSFHANVSRTFRGTNAFDIFCFKQGMLFLHNPDPQEEARKRVNKGAMIGGLLGGAVGAVVGGMIDSANQDVTTRQRNNLSLCTDEEILSLAAHRKLSFAADYDDVSYCIASARSGWFGGNSAGSFLLKIKKFGKVGIEFPLPSDMTTAIQTMEKKLGDRFESRVVWNDQKFCFAAK